MLLSEKRYIHTLGVADMAVRLGEFFLPMLCDELYVAALLHDVAKELSASEIEALLSGRENYLTPDDIASPDVIHSLIAPLVIERDYPEYATENVISAVYNHTLGDENMTLFSEIIFISDFIEMGRRYKACIDVREELLSNLSDTATVEENLYFLKRAVYQSLDFTVRYISEKNGVIHPKTVLARNRYRALI